MGALPLETWVGRGREWEHCLPGTQVGVRGWVSTSHQNLRWGWGGLGSTAHQELRWGEGWGALPTRNLVGWGGDGWDTVH